MTSGFLLAREAPGWVKEQIPRNALSDSSIANVYVSHLEMSFERCKERLSNYHIASLMNSARGRRGDAFAGEERSLAKVIHRSIGMLRGKVQRYRRSRTLVHTAS